MVDTTFIAPVAAASAAAAKATFTSGTLTPHTNPNLADADITFTGATVSIPMGDFLMGAIGALVFQPLYGIPDFKAGLVAMVDCDSIASSAASAVSGLLTEAELKAVCVAGAGLAADQVITQFEKLQVNGATITAGRATLYDVSTPKPTADRQSDHVGDGVWTWTFDTAVVPSTFAGDRIP